MGAWKRAQRFEIIVQNRNLHTPRSPSVRSTRWSCAKWEPELIPDAFQHLYRSRPMIVPALPGRDYRFFRHPWQKTIRSERAEVDGPKSVERAAHRRHRIFEPAGAIEQHNSIAGLATRPSATAAHRRRELQLLRGKATPLPRCATLRHACNRRVADGHCESAALAHRAHDQKIADRVRHPDAGGDRVRVLPERRVLPPSSNALTIGAQPPPAPRPFAAASVRSSRSLRVRRTLSTCRSARCRRRSDRKSRRAASSRAARPVRAPSSSCPRSGTAL